MVQEPPERTSKAIGHCSVVGVLLTASGTVWGQERVDLFASPTNMNVLYHGVDNPVDVLVPGVKCEDLEITVSQGTLEGDSCTYTIRPERYSRTLLMEARWMQAGEQRTASRPFRVKEIPLAEAYLAGRSVLDDSLRRIEAQATQGVILRLNDFLFDIKITVVTYRLQVLRDCAVVFDGISEEAALTVQMKAALSQVQEGDIVRVMDILARYPDGRDREISPLRFVIY